MSYAVKAMNYEERTKEVFEFLYNPIDGLLRRFTAPEYLSPDRQRSEINDMVDDINSEIPSTVGPPELRLIFQKLASYVRKKHNGRAWPTIKTLCDGVRFALRDTETKQGTADEKLMIEMLKKWHEKFKSPLPSVARSDRTDLMIEEGIFTAREARFYGYPLSEKAKESASEEVIPHEERKHHIRVMAKLKGIDECEAEAEVMEDWRKKAERERGFSVEDVAKKMAPKPMQSQAQTQRNQQQATRNAGGEG